MRLDIYLAEQKFSSRTKAARAIADGLVYVNGRPGKASDEVAARDQIVVRERPFSFVSEGGYKLRKAFDDFGTNVRDCSCVDLGASTGGFTDCLLQAGAAEVFSVDVGQDQLDPAISGDERVHAMDGVNVRYLKREDLPMKKIDVVTADLSFISLKLIFPVIALLLDEGGFAYILIKPQFECGGAGLNKHGILKDRKSRLDIVTQLADEAAKNGLEPISVTEAPIRENKNIEYIVQFRRSEPASSATDRFKKRIAELK